MGINKGHWNCWFIAVAGALFSLALRELGECKFYETHGWRVEKRKEVGMKEWFHSAMERSQSRIEKRRYEARKEVWESEGTQLYAQWSAIGVSVRLAEPARLERSVMGENSVLLIEIRHSPIGWCEVVRKREGGAPGESTRVYYGNFYLVYDNTIDREERLELESVRVKKIPVFGKVIDLRWEGFYESDLYMRMNQGVLPKQRKESLLEWRREMVERLNQDAKLKQTLIGLKEDIEICSFPEYECWAISSSHQWIEEQLAAPSREQWDCYERVARRLLEAIGK